MAAMPEALKSHHWIVAPSISLKEKVPLHKGWTPGSHTYMNWEVETFHYSQIGFGIPRFEFGFENTPGPWLMQTLLLWFQLFILRCLFYIPVLYRLQPTFFRLYCKHKLCELKSYLLFQLHICTVKIFCDHRECIFEK